MKRSRFTDRQMMDALKRVEAGLAVLPRARHQQMPAFHKWRSKECGMDKAMISWLKELEAENIRLKTMVA